MRGAKELDGKRVRLLRPFETAGGRMFDTGTEGTFQKLGTVRCSFKTDDGRTLDAGHMRRGDFAIVEA